MVLVWFFAYDHTLGTDNVVLVLLLRCNNSGESNTLARAASLNADCINSDHSAMTLIRFIVLRLPSSRCNTFVTAERTILSSFAATVSSSYRTSVPFSFTCIRPLCPHRNVLLRRFRAVRMHSICILAFSWKACVCRQKALRILSHYEAQGYILIVRWWASIDRHNWLQNTNKLVWHFAVNVAFLISKLWLASVVSLQCTGNYHCANKAGRELTLYSYDMFCLVERKKTSETRACIEWNCIFIDVDACDANYIALLSLFMPNTGWAKKVDHFWKYVTPVYDDIGRRSVYQNVQLFIRRKTDILNVAMFKYSLHGFRETTLHRKYQLI